MATRTAQIQYGKILKNHHFRTLSTTNKLYVQSILRAIKKKKKVRQRINTVAKHIYNLQLQQQVGFI